MHKPLKIFQVLRVIVLVCIAVLVTGVFIVDLVTLRRPTHEFVEWLDHHETALVEYADPEADRLLSWDSNRRYYKVGGKLDEEARRKFKGFRNVMVGEKIDGKHCLVANFHGFIVMEKQFRSLYVGRAAEVLEHGKFVVIQQVRD